MVSTQPVTSSVQLSGAPVVISQDLFDIGQSTAQQCIGDAARTNDGRSFRYVYNGGVAMVAGALQQAAAETTAHQQLAVAASAAGTNTITTTSTVTLTANQYQFGYAFISVTPDAGRLYPIQSHPAVTSAVVTITLNSALDVALNTSSKVSLVMNPYASVIINPTTATSAPVGVGVVPLPINYYGWIQTGGVANVLIDGTTAVGADVVASNGTAGAVEVQVAGSSSVIQATVGTAYNSGVTTDYCAIFLKLGQA